MYQGYKIRQKSRLTRFFSDFRTKVFIISLPQSKFFNPPHYFLIFFPYHDSYQRRFMKKIILLLSSPLIMIAQSIDLDTVLVHGSEEKGESLLIQKEGYMNKAPMQKQITIEQALQSAGTNGDPIKALSTFAGVVSTNNDTGSEIYIHGSKPRETRYSINHLPLGYLFHLGGLHSVLAPEMMGQIDAYLGGFDVSYEAMGAVVDITPKYPSGSDSGRVHLGMYDADFAYDGKIGDNTQLFVGARRSYFDLIAADMMDALNEDEKDPSKKTTFTLFPQFYDGQILLTHTMDEHAFSLEGVIAKDEMKLHDTMQQGKDPLAVGKINSDISSDTIGLRWVYMGENMSANTLIYRLHTKQKLGLYDSDFYVDTKSREYGIYHESVFMLENHKPMVGFECKSIHVPFRAHITAPSVDDFEPPLIDKEVVTLDKTFNAKTYTAFAQDIWDVTSRSHFRYGLRAWSTDFQAFGEGVDPRVAWVYDLSDSMTIAAAVGKYSQLPETLYLIDGFGNPKIDTYEFATHYTLSVQKDFGHASSIMIEPYFKRFENLAIDDETLHYKGIGKGEAYGVDVTYKKKLDNLDIIAAYTFVKAKRQLRTSSQKQYRFEGDIPHTLQISSKYHFDSGWRVSSLLKYIDGAVYTPVVDTESYTYAGKEYKRPIYGTPYSQRLPSTFDLDIQIGKEVKFANKKSLEFSIELMNVTSLFRKNVAGIKYNDAYEKDGEQYQMGFLPTLHVNYRF